MVSTPTFDPQSETGVAQEKGVYVNRLLSGSYAPGSIFKLVTALSALENLSDVHDRRYTCRRGVTIGGEWLSCMGNHGSVDLQGALVGSCNAAFAQFALDLGESRMTKTAEKVGINKTLTMDGIACTPSRYQVDGANQIDFGWSGIGQYNDTVNPFQFLTFMGGIAGDGTCVWPYLVEDVSSLSGKLQTAGGPKRVTMMDKSSARTLSDMMRKDVTDNYGEGNFAGLELCAKTGTAEIGDKSTPHSWFVGFCRAENKPYAFVVVVENAGAGLGAASRIASTVLHAAPKQS
jgi:peptidoglycan glycosyltransferase